jgi:hypothetical protein
MASQAAATPGIGQREVALVGQALGRADGNLARRRPAMIFKCGFAQILFHEISLGFCNWGNAI